MRNAHEPHRPNDNYYHEHCHVPPVLIWHFRKKRKSGTASATCWSGGSLLREFLFVDDFANVCVFLMDNYFSSKAVNAGMSKTMTIKGLTELVTRVVG